MTEDHTEAIMRLQGAVGALRDQVSCGCRGHKVSISNVHREAAVIYGYGFKCIYCDIEYDRTVNELTERELALVGLVEK